MKNFVYFDEKTLESVGNPLAFCTLFLYNNANLLQGGPELGRIDRNRIRERRHRQNKPVRRYGAGPGGKRGKGAVYRL